MELFDTKVVEEVKKENIGKIIDRGGHVIKKITNENKFKIGTGNWCEKVNDNEDTSRDKEGQ